MTKVVISTGTIADGEICFTQRDICSMTGVSPATLSTWIKSGILPRPTRVVGMRRLFTGKQKDRVCELIKEKRGTVD